MDARNPTLVEIDVSGDGGTRATYWLLVTKNSSQFSCPGRNANPALVDGVDTTCLGKESTVETVPAVVRFIRRRRCWRGKDRATPRRRGGWDRGEGQHYWETTDLHLNLVPTTAWRRTAQEGPRQRQLCHSFSPANPDCSSSRFRSGVQHTVERFRVEPKAPVVDYDHVAGARQVASDPKLGAATEEIVGAFVLGRLSYAFDGDARDHRDDSILVGPAEEGLGLVGDGGMHDQHEFYHEPSPTPLVISRDDQMAAVPSCEDPGRSVRDSRQARAALALARTRQGRSRRELRASWCVVASRSHDHRARARRDRPSNSTDQLLSYKQGAQHLRRTKVIDVDLRDSSETSRRSSPRTAAAGV